MKINFFQKKETPREKEIFYFFPQVDNHLGNVLEVVTDRKLAIDDGSGGVDYYVADVVSQSDYFPFGMLLPNTNIEPEKVYNAIDDVWEDVAVVEDNDYRYGFNGMEKDDEVTNQKMS